MADKAKKHEKPDLDLLGKFVYFYPRHPSGNTIGTTAPLPNQDGTPHPGNIYCVRAPDDEDVTKVHVRVWAHGQAYALEDVVLWHEGEGHEPIAVFPADDEKRLKANADAAEKEAKEAEKNRLAEEKAAEHVAAKAAKHHDAAHTAKW